MDFNLTLDDFDYYRPNCSNCIRQGQSCPRNISNKAMSKGLVKGIYGQSAGLIYKCLNYYNPKFNLSQMYFDYE